MSNLAKILLHRGTGTISRLIRWQTNGNYSHASIQFPHAIYEAWHRPSGWRVRPEAPNWSQVDAFDIAGLDAQGSDQMLKWCVNHLGTPYDYGGVLRFVTRWRKPKDDKLFCSEGVFQCVQESTGIQLLDRIMLAQVHPTILSFSPLLIPTKPYPHPSS